MKRRHSGILLASLVLLLPVFPTALRAESNAYTKSRDKYYADLDALNALWSFYKYQLVSDGRVLSPENKFSSSEGQGYGMLRAAWAGDRDAFDQIWKWTRDNLQTRGDALFSWKWDGRVLDKNSATDADTDIALALVLASRRFSAPEYLDQARPIIHDIWEIDIYSSNGRAYVTAGDWSPSMPAPVVRVGYLAPYAYEVFAGVDRFHPWKKLVKESYALLHWIYFDKNLKVPPEVVYVDRSSGDYSLSNPATGLAANFSYDVYPLFWRVATDAKWFFRPDAKLRRRMLAFFESEWASKSRILDQYQTDGSPASNFEGLPLYATVHSLAVLHAPAFAQALREKKLDALWAEASAFESTVPYYLHNWLWFDRALELHIARRYDEVAGFLYPLDFSGVVEYFPWLAFTVFIFLFLLTGVHRVFRFGFFVAGFYLGVRYLWWRAFNTLNWVEWPGTIVSILLLSAECYFLSTVALLLLQVGVGGKAKKPKYVAATVYDPLPVDVLIPIYKESIEILEKTLIAATAMRYPSKTVYVLDDGHRETVRATAERYGAKYLPGPQKRSKAANLNAALAISSSPLVAVFDTDHIPLTSFLQETVPAFSDPKIGFVQTPHHFYNDDIFQRAFGNSKRVPSEQDMFHHGIQGGRNEWDGAFFVGSGAVFRRKALEDIQGFPLMSITEDIYASQKIHSAGWKSLFIDKDLVVGLHAENLAAYLTQRRRWMLGTLQVFFKDNPLFARGLRLRLRFGYFASLYYFFFPIARCILWVTPVCFLLFHWHGILGDMSHLVAVIVPFIVAQTLMTAVILPGWPRLIWGDMYEFAVSAPLLRSMVDLVLPKQLSFKATPKGIISETRKFDWGSAGYTVAAMAVTLIAVTKGLLEVYFFDVEKDAYFFNILWAFFNIFHLSVALSIAWERRQRRRQDRIQTAVPYKLFSHGTIIKGLTNDVSLSGFSIIVRQTEILPEVGTLALNDEAEFLCSVRQVFFERVSPRAYRAGYEFVDMSEPQYRDFVKNILSSPMVWENAHDHRYRRNSGMFWRFFAGLFFNVTPLKTRRRKNPRATVFQWHRANTNGGERSVLVTNQSQNGLRAIYFGKAPAAAESSLLTNGHQREMKPVYTRMSLPFVWIVGYKDSRAARQ